MHNPFIKLTFYRDCSRCIRYNRQKMLPTIQIYLETAMTTSGNFSVFRSAFRLYISTELLSMDIYTINSTKFQFVVLLGSITWARSPSYLYSQVNSISWNLFTISDTPLVGFANIGPTGTPSVKLHVCGRFHTPPLRRAGTILS